MPELDAINTADDEVKEFADGDLEPELLTNVLTDSKELFGKWQLIKDRSESHDSVLSVLGVPYMKRAIMRNSAPVTVISEDGEKDGHPCIKLVTHLPMGLKKEAEILTDMHPFDIDDGDTGHWTTTAKVVNGRLLQKRVSGKGPLVMYDVRGVVQQDPLGKVKEEPLMVFKWGVVDTKTGKKTECHRWMKKVKE